MTLGEKISSERKRGGYSQEALADKCGISLRTLQRIETNQSVPRPYTLKVIADSLDLSIDDLTAHEQAGLTDNHTASRLNLINSSALLVILFPLLSIAAPMLLWHPHRQHPILNEKGKKIISFQLIWLILSVVALLITHFSHYLLTGAFVSGRLPIVVIVYVLLLILNVSFVIHASFQLRKGIIKIYPLVPTLF